MSVDITKTLERPPWVFYNHIYVFLYYAVLLLSHYNKEKCVEAKQLNNKKWIFSNSPPYFVKVAQSYNLTKTKLNMQHVSKIIITITNKQKKTTALQKSCPEVTFFNVSHARWWLNKQMRLLDI